MKVVPGTSASSGGERGGVMGDSVWAGLKNFAVGRHFMFITSQGSM